MLEMKCSRCGRHLAVNERYSGREARCPGCGNPFTVPGGRRPEPPPRPSPEATIYCPRCGRRNLENNFKCEGCGFVLHGPAPPPAAAGADYTFGGLIPYRNSRALWAYYLGVFSLIPFLGIPLGFAALVLGILGLKYAKAHPEARGKIHAWTGIILGGICGIGYTVGMAAAFLLPKIL